MTRPKYRKVPSAPGVEISPAGDIRVNGKPRKSCWSRVGRSLVITVKINNCNTTLRPVRLLGEAWSSSFRPHLVPKFKDGNPRNIVRSNVTWVARSEITVAPYGRNPRQN